MTHERPHRWTHPRTMFTIGVYGFELPSFLAALREADVGLLLDVRQRRGVRGPDYSWANSQRLQSALAAAGIGYRHHRELAPTTELRHLQYAEDARQRVSKRTRRELAPEYTRRYESEILNQVDLVMLLGSIPHGQKAALLCVERDAEACHRSLIANRLSEQLSVRCVHLAP